MYTAYWKFDEKPFDNSLSAAFYYPGESNQGALLKLRYSIENRCGGAVLAGVAGVGKSLIVNTLFRQLPDEFSPCVHIVFPQLPADQLLAYIADELGTTATDPAARTAAASLRRIQNFLSDNTRAGRHAVIAIDEAHLLDDPQVQEALRMLLNFQTDGATDMSLLLVGQTKLLTNLERMPGFDERLGVKCLLRPFVEEETVSYVNHRTTTAGAQRAIFTDDALTAIHELSRGIPRRINRLCDLALLIGYAEQLDAIRAEQIDAVCDEMVTVDTE